MSQTMRDRLIEILEAWERDIYEDGMAAAAGRNMGYDGAGKVLDLMLSALRTPDEAMIEAAYTDEWDWGPGSGHDAPDAEPGPVFTAMIDAVRMKP